MDGNRTGKRVDQVNAVMLTDRRAAVRTRGKHLAPDGIARILVQFEDATRPYPRTVVASLDREELAVIAYDGGADADRMARKVGGVATSVVLHG